MPKKLKPTKHIPAKQQSNLTDFSDSSPQPQPPICGGKLAWLLLAPQFPLADFLFAHIPSASKLSPHYQLFRRNLPMTERSNKARRRNRELADGSEPTAAKPVRRRRWPWILAALLVVVYFLPAIVTSTSIKQSAIDWALADFQGKVSAENVSIGWFSAAKLSGVKAIDEQGQTLLEIEQVNTSKSLIGWIGAGQDLGNIEVQSPILYLQLRPDGSNLEDALVEYLKPTDEPNAPLPHVQLSVVGGKVHLSTAGATQAWLVDELSLSAEIAGQKAAAVANLSAIVQAADQTAGNLSLKIELDAGSDRILIDNGHVEVDSKALPVSFLTPLAQRLIGPCNAVGEINGQANLVFSSGGGEVSADLKELEVTQFAMVAPEYLKTDQVSLERFKANGQLRFSPQGVHAEGFETVSDLGKLVTDGEIDFAQLTTLMNGQVPAADFSAHGEIDIAKLANMLPATFALHQDLHVQSGSVTFDAVTRTDAGVRRLLLDLTAANLTAQRGAELLSWHKPLRITARVGQMGEQLVLENVKCESDFLTVEGSANTDVGNFIASGDLAQLRENLSQFVDLSGVDLAGEMSGEFGWSFRNDDSAAPQTQSSDRPIQIGGKFEIDRPVIQMPGVQRWAAPQLSIICNAVGAQRTGGVIQLEQGGARVIVDQEILTVRLAESVPNIATAERLSLSCELSGRVDGWLAHVRNFIWVGDFDASGQVAISSPAIVSREQIQLTNLTYTVSSMQFEGYGASFTESQVTGEGKLSYDLNSGLILAPVFNVASSSIAARADQIQLTFTDVIELTGDVVFRADVNRVADWFGISPDADSVNWFGTAEGNVKLTSDRDSLYGQLEAVVNDLVAAQPATQLTENRGPVRSVGHESQWSELMREKQVKLSSKVGVAQDFDSISFQGLEMVASAIQLVGQGAIRDLAGTWQTNFQGEWNPDWQKVNGLLDAYTYETIQLAGRGQQPIEISGPLFSAVGSQYESAWFPPELQVRTQLNWNAGNVLHLPLEAGAVNVDLNQSVAFLKTSELPFVGGVLQAAPVVDLRGEEPVLLLEKGVLLSNANLSSDICRDFLKYVTPLVADATEAQGKLTVQHEGLRMPLYQPTQVQAQGTLQLHEGTIGAGPLAKQLFSVVSQVKQLLKPGSTLGAPKSVWMDLGNQEIPFSIDNGRVNHQGIRLRIDDVIIETDGSVGFDQSLNLIAKIPIQDAWLGDNRWLEGLRGQSLQIPISGTVSQPRLDTQSIQQLSRQLIQQAAGGAINGAVQDQVGELQNKFGNELDEAREKLNNKIQDALGNELQKGLEGIFKRK